MKTLQLSPFFDKGKGGRRAVAPPNEFMRRLRMRKRTGALGATTMAIAALAFAAPASALVVTWYDHDVNYFSGAGCASRSQVTVVLRHNAFDVKVVRPKLGAKLTDETTGQTDATVTAIRRTAGGMTFTATGSDDVCSHPDRYSTAGWQTKDVHFDIDYTTREQARYPSACGSTAYKPSRIVVACKTGDFYVDHIRWSSWTDQSALGVGTGHAGSGSGRHLHAYSGVTVKLDRLRYCASNGDFEFTRLRYHYTGKHPAGRAATGFGRSGCARS